MSESVAVVEQKLERNIAVDAYRGLVMLLMMAEVLELAYVHKTFFPNSLFWRILGDNQSHSEWAGMSLHDTIQPGFTFLVGVALPYSVRSRLKKGATFSRLLGHTLWRSLILVALGIFLRSPGSNDQFRLYGYFGPNWPGLHLCLSTYLRSAALAVDRVWGNSLRLLAGMGAVSRAWSHF